MIYQTGTITTTAGQTKIKGTGTRWKDNLAGISEGCPISYLINNVVYMNTVLSVNSDTEINLTYPVPVAASAAKYQIATFVLDSMSDGVRKMLANQQYIQYFLRNMDTWMTQDGIVEIKTPTGETVKLESIIALKKLIDGKATLATKSHQYFDGEVRGRTAIGVWSEDNKNALLMSVARGAPDFYYRVNDVTYTITMPSGSGALMKVGDYGIGSSTGVAIPNGDYNNIIASGFYMGTGASGVNAPPGQIRYGGVIAAFRYHNEGFIISAHKDDVSIRVKTAEQGWGDHFRFYTTKNTTKDANGNLRAASPIIKVFSDHIELNDESEGVELEKLGTGRYKLKGTLGMNSDASWGGIHGGLVVPNGINNLPLVWADFDVLPDGDIIIETRYRKHTLHPRLEAQRLMTYPEFLDENNIEREDYDYCDIPNGHWIDVRVNMPSDSIYNQKIAEAERLAKIEAERVAKEEAEKEEQELI
ncbi:phage tail fiber protein [Providencia rustigianii]|uniref:phage tail fiber protein n=1 Tax=Providencia rustigianii TaxID=158850 RepID=UPI00223EBF08|nr:hypothetical protein [Providencia rustigianii]